MIGIEMEFTVKTCRAYLKIQKFRRGLIYD